MATIKSFTDLQQSKKLAEFLPLESADMRYAPIGDIHPWVWEGNPKLLETDSTPCWSLAALLGVLPNGTDICKNIEGRYYVHGFFSDNPVDACVDAIKALHELNLL
jgi:hypothetical protein